MYRKLSPLIFCLLVYSAPALAYNGDYSCPKFYVGISTGLNNQSGLLGPNFDIPITKWFSFGLGAGRSSWGFKGYSEGRFYLGDCNRKFALGAGMTYNTGIKNFTTALPTTDGTTDVKLVFEPSLNASFSAYYFFNLGRDGNHRFYLQAGYSYPLDDMVYQVKSKHTLTDEGKAVMQILSPGGVIFALGFSFGFGGY